MYTPERKVYASTERGFSAGKKYGILDKNTQTGGEWNMKKLVIGILAHVDAGKTTLSEAMLYTTGTIRTLGRVDHRDAFLDTESLERDHAYLTAGGVFPEELICNWIKLKRAEEEEIARIPTPAEFQRYYTL